jgi:hypothetical protein
MALDHITYELLHSRMLAWHAEEMRCKFVYHPALRSVLG